MITAFHVLVFIGVALAGIIVHDVVVSLLNRKGK
jgi:hypothetical protein